MAIIQSGTGTDILTIDSTTKGAHVVVKNDVATYFTNQNFTKDSFERLRVSEPRIAFEHAFNSLSPSSYTTIWEATAYGAGTIGLTSNLYGTDMGTTTANATGYRLQSYDHIRYAPGVSTLLRFTFCFNELITNVTMRLGMFTDQGSFPTILGDGLFLEASGSTVSFVRRSLAESPAGFEERINQSNWNLDKLDGTGASGTNLNWSKAQHLVIEFQYLGVGTIRFGFETGADGVVWAHEIHNVNNLSTAWARTGSLPVRAECFSTNAVAQAGKLTLINCCVLQEGDVAQQRGWKYFGATSGATAKVGGTATGLYPVMSLQAVATNDLTKRATIVPVSVEVSVAVAATGATTLQVALLMLPTPNTGATFAVTTASALGRVDIAATATTAITGVAIWTAIVPNVVGTYSYDLSATTDNANAIGYPASGTGFISGISVLTLAVGPLTGTCTVAPTVVGAINWKEIG